MKKLVLPIVFILLSAAAPIYAEETKPLEEMRVLLEKIQTGKKQVVQQNMALSKSEANVFWPIYDAYQTDLQKINERLTKLILRYADGYSNDTITNEEATAILAEVLNVETSEVAMRKNYATKLATVLPGKKAARYIQIEIKVRAAVRYGMAANIPLVKLK